MTLESLIAAVVLLGDSRKAKSEYLTVGAAYVQQQ